MREAATHVCQSGHHLILKWLALRLELIEAKLGEAVLRHVLAAKKVKKLVSHPRLAVKLMNSDTAEGIITQVSLNPVFNVVYDPGHRSLDSVFS